MKKGVVFAAILILVISGVFVLNQETKVTLQQSPLDLFLKDHSTTSEIAKAYKIAYENPQNVLSEVKCYCGCIQNNGHKSSRACFIKENGDFDLMGLNCGLCVKIAITSKEMLDQGKTVQEISKFVDSKWGRLN